MGAGQALGCLEQHGCFPRCGITPPPPSLPPGSRCSSKGGRYSSLYSTSLHSWLWISSDAPAWNSSCAPSARAVSSQGGRGVRGTRGGKPWAAGAQVRAALAAAVHGAVPGRLDPSAASARQGRGRPERSAAAAPRPLAQLTREQAGGHKQGGVRLKARVQHGIAVQLPHHLQRTSRHELLA